MPLVDVFSVVFPVFVVIGVGFLFARFKKISLEPIIEILLYITIPALVISSLSERKFYVSELLHVAISVIFVIAITAIISYIYLRLTGKRELRGFYLPTIFMNSGNMAFPLALLAFGAEGLSVAVLYYITVGLSVYTLGVYICKGSDGIKEIFKLPLIYAAAFALTLNLLDIELPDEALTATTMLGAATIPLMQIALGYRLYSTRITHLGDSIISSLIRIIGGFVAAYFITELLGIGGVSQKVIILSSAMPAAVINFVMSHKYKLQSELVASAIAMSTLISLVSTPLLLLWLMSK